MNLVLTFCWKEWRMQRGLLVAYSLLVFTCLALGLWVAPTHLWLDERFGAHALSWFVAAGMLGVILFAAPNLVRTEFGPKDDLFVRRLPGALGPSFGGKLLFLILVALALPLAGLAIGELYVTARGEHWHGLFGWRWDGGVVLDWPEVVVGCAGALLAVPWIWAVGTWLPGGRMALGGTILLALVLGIGVVAVLRQSPGIEKGLAWQTWLWFVPPSGLAVAFVSWTKGRRGGGPLRSARCGFGVLALGLVAPGAWLADRVYDYHHPDLQQLAKFDVRGLSPDGGFALAVGAAHEDFAQVPLRIELATGRAEQLGGIGTQFATELLKPSPLAMQANRRYWRLYDWSPWTERFLRHEVFDLASGERTTIGYDPKGLMMVLDGPLRAAIGDELRQRTPFRAPEGVHVWFEPGAACFAGSDGQVERTVMPEGIVTVRPYGHGAYCYGKEEGLFDFTTRAFVPGVKSQGVGFLVRGVRVFPVSSNRDQGKWLRAIGTAAAEPLRELDEADVLGLFDDDRLLCRTRKWGKDAGQRVFLYEVAARTRTELVLPPDAGRTSSVEVVVPLYAMTSLLPRDPAGRIWLVTHEPRGHDTFVVLDTLSRTLRSVLPHSGDYRERYQLLAWRDGSTILVQSGARILRVDVESGRVTQLFPR